MANKQYIDELSIEELERILAIKKRKARQEQLGRMKQTERVTAPEQTVPPRVEQPPTPPIQPTITDNQLPSETVSIPSSSVERRKVQPEFEDDIGDINAHKAETKLDTNGDDSSRRRLIDLGLMVIEIAAVVGLILIGLEMLNGIGIMQDQTIEAKRTAEEKQRETIPTLEPTPQLKLMDVVLPSGHTPPSELDGGQFNFDEIPAQMRSLVASQVYLPLDVSRPPPTDETPLVLRIPKLNIDHRIIQGVDWEALKLGIGQVQNGATPADGNGNIVLAAHNDIYGELFRDLDQLESGDTFQIQTKNSLYTYTITEWDIYDPTDVYVMESRDKPGATLISSYPYQVNAQRIVVFANLDETP